MLTSSCLASSASFFFLFEALTFSFWGAAAFRMAASSWRAAASILAFLWAAADSAALTASTGFSFSLTLPSGIDKSSMGLPTGTRPSLGKWLLRLGRLKAERYCKGCLARDHGEILMMDVRVQSHGKRKAAVIESISNKISLAVLNAS